MSCRRKSETRRYQWPHKMDLGPTKTCKIVYKSHSISVYSLIRVVAAETIDKPCLLMYTKRLYIVASSEEYELLQKAHACCKEILNYVNQAVRDCENHMKLVDFQRRLDKRSIENSTHPVILEYKVFIALVNANIVKGDRCEYSTRWVKV